MTNKTKEFEQEALANGVVDLETLRHEEQDILAEQLVDDTEEGFSEGEI